MRADDDRVSSVAGELETARCCHLVTGVDSEEWELRGGGLEVEAGREEYWLERVADVLRDNAPSLEGKVYLYQFRFRI